MEAGEILLRRGLLDQRQLAQTRAQANGHGDGIRLIESAVQLGFVTEEAALRAVGDEVGIEYIDLAEADVDLSLLKTFPQRLIHRQTLFPIRRDHGQLLVATSNPFDLYPLDEVSAATGYSVMPVLASRVEISKLIKRHLGVGSETVDGLVAQAAKDEEEGIELLSEIETDGSELSEMAQEASVVRLVNEILLEAIESRTSDVHIESQPSGLVIRYRIDGLLQTQPVPPEINRFQSAIISRLKIMARLNIAEKRLPQDGRMKLKVQGREIDIRVSIIPMIHGEGIVMRLLDKGRMVFNLANVGMLPDIYNTFKKLIDLPHGIVLVTGPTGSGKSTTLYSALNEIKDETLKIITVEDPVEYQQDGISQIQTHSKIGLTFAASLRSILRHDPDVILIGEMRDRETFEAALQAAETGHLVFGTIHASSATQAFGRIYDLFPPEERENIRNLLAFQMQAFIYQKLLPTLHKDIPRIPAVEILLQSPPTRKYILEGREVELDQVIKSHREYGMQSFTDSLVDLVEREFIHPRVAQANATSPEEVKMRLRGISTS